MIKSEESRMNKALLLSIKPEHAIKILKGEKTLELRKSVPKGFKGWVYCYVTKGKPNYYTVTVQHNGGQAIRGFTKEELGLTYKHNGQIPFRFWFDEYISYKYYADDNVYFPKRPQDIGYNADEVLKHLGLTREQFKWYGHRKDLYAWHIKQLDIFYEPMKLGEFVKDFPYASRDVILREIKNQKLRITKAPQSYQYVWVKEELK